MVRSQFFGREKLENCPRFPRQSRLAVSLLSLSVTMVVITGCILSLPPQERDYYVQTVSIYVCVESLRVMLP